MHLRYIILSILLCTAAQAQINVSGDVSGIWGETELVYHVVGDVTVPAGLDLTILPGVEVRFLDDYDFTVNGGLQVQGTPDDSVRFVYHYGSVPGAWGALILESVPQRVVQLDYCLIESGRRALDVIACNITINHSLIRGTEVTPVIAENAEIVMDSCVVTQSAGSGIGLIDTYFQANGIEVSYHTGTIYGRGISATGGTLNITGGYIGHNAGEGIYGSSLTDVNLDDLEVAENGSYGINLINCNGLDAHRVLVHHNDNHGFLLNSTSMTARNLTVSANGSRGIHTLSGIMQLTSSIIDNHGDWGIYCQSGSGFVSYNCAYNNVGNYYGCLPGTGSIEENPMYVSLPQMDYNLLLDSPCIDAGSPNDPLDPDGTTTDMGRHYFDQTPVSPKDIPAIVSGFEISAYPNPFNPVLNITIKTDRPQVGTLEAWTSQGRLAASIWSGFLHQGINKTTWNAEHFPSGTYHIRLKTAETTKTYTCVLLK